MQEDDKKKNRVVICGGPTIGQSVAKILKSIYGPKHTVSRGKGARRERKEERGW